MASGKRRDEGPGERPDDERPDIRTELQEARRELAALRESHQRYQGILECAESLTGYLAVLGLLLSRELDVPLGAVASLRDKLATMLRDAIRQDQARQ